MNMSGYEITDEDVQAITKWLDKHYPESANEEFAKEMLLSMKTAYRKLGREDPDALIKAYQDLIDN